jgi:hypothetical protein
MNGNKLPLSVRDLPPDARLGWTKVECGVGLSGLPEGIHTGGPWLSPDGLEVWKPCDGRPFANSDGHYPTDELTALAALSGKPGFPQNWRAVTCTNDGLERTWIVRKKAPVLGQDWPKRSVRLEQVLRVEQAVRSMNEAWWELGDGISVALDPDTYEPYLLDLSCAMHRPGAQGCYKPDDWWQLEAWLKWLGMDRLVNLRNEARSFLYPGIIARKERQNWPGDEWIHVYASRNRPMSAVWARIEDAHYIDSDYAETGVWTWAVTPEPVPDDKVFSYELTWAWSPLDYEVL